MKFVILAALATVALAVPQPDKPSSGYGQPSARSFDVDSREQIAIIKQDQVMEEDGRFNVDVETANGILMSQSGSPDGPDDSVIKSGQYSYTAPDGTPVVVKYVADENGFQPQSDLLPVAPEFPHPIPQFVLDQIAFAAEEDAARARGDFSSEESRPSYTYSSPQ